MDLNALVERARREVHGGAAAAVRRRLTLPPLAERLVYEYGRFVTKIIENERRAGASSLSSSSSSSSPSSDAAAEAADQAAAAIASTVDLPVEMVARIAVAMAASPVRLLVTSRTLARYIRLALHEQFLETVGDGYARVDAWRGRSNSGTDALAGAFTAQYTLARPIATAAPLALRFFARTRIGPAALGARPDALPAGVDALCADALAAIREHAVDPGRAVAVWQVAVMEMVLLYEGAGPPDLAPQPVLFAGRRQAALPPSPSPSRETARALERFGTLCALWAARDRVAVVFWLACFYEQWLLYYDARQRDVLLALQRLFVEHVYRLATADERALEPPVVAQLAEFLQAFWVSGNLAWRGGSATARRVLSGRTGLAAYVRAHRASAAPEADELRAVLDRLVAAADDAAD